jgi:hypothetical protein
LEAKHCVDGREHTDTATSGRCKSRCKSIRSRVSPIVENPGRFCRTAISARLPIYLTGVGSVGKVCKQPARQQPSNPIAHASRAECSCYWACGPVVRRVLDETFIEARHADRHRGRHYQPRPGAGSFACCCPAAMAGSALCWQHLSTLSYSCADSTRCIPGRDNKPLAARTARRAATAGVARAERRWQPGRGRRRWR